MVELMEPMFRCRSFGAVDLAFVSSQRNPDCKNFEYSYADCVDAYGYYNGRKKCMFYLEDLAECLFKSKQGIRVNTMARERNRQINEGKRGYLPYPRSDLL